MIKNLEHKFPVILFGCFIQQNQMHVTFKWNYKADKDD